MRCVRVAWLLGLLVSLVAVRDGHAEGSIHDGAATFSLRADHFFDATADLLGVSTEPDLDYLFSEGWWYRLAGDEAETFLPEPDQQDYAGATATLRWDDVDGRGAFRALETDTILDTGGPSARVTLSLKITNLSASAPLEIDVFHMADVDVGGSLNDSAVLAGKNLIRITDGPNSTEYLGSGADGFLVAPSDASVASVLFDGAADEFVGAGLPFGPGDVTAGFQWGTAVIPPSGERTFSVVIAANTSAIPGSVTTSTTSSTSVPTVVPTSTTTLPSAREACDDCRDNDADGLVDFEDPDCCAVLDLVPIPLAKGKLKARGTGNASVALAATLPAAALPASPVVDDVTIQVRRTNGAGLLCARIPAATLHLRRGKLKFRDPKGSTAGARGIDRVTIVPGKNGAGRLTVAGKLVPLALPEPGPLSLTVALRNPATAETTNRCAVATGEFASKRKGLVLR